MWVSWPGLVLWLMMAALAGGYLFCWLRRQVLTRQAHEKAQLSQIRSGIAANLHDELGSLLMRIHLEAELMLSQAHGDDVHLKRLLTHTQAACSAMRDVAWGLDASADALHSLQDRMRDLLDELALSTPQRITFTVEGLEDVVALPARLRQEVYLVFKEAITNAMRHARGASCLAVQLFRQKNNLVLEVKDDGTAAAAVSRSGVGLRNMERRAQAVGGTLAAGPRLDGPGFRVCFCAPLAPMATSSWLFRQVK